VGFESIDVGALSKEKTLPKGIGENARGRIPAVYVGRTYDMGRGRRSRFRFSSGAFGQQLTNYGRIFQYTPEMESDLCVWFVKNIEVQ
jgi:hypothetical protein